MYIDWEQGEKLVDGSGSYLRRVTQIDSLMFLVTLRNLAWPCGKNLIVSANGSDLIIPIDNPECQPPDLTGLKNRIFLENEKNISIRPSVLWGLAQNSLMREETIFIKFQLWDGETHILDNSARVFLHLTGFERDIRLEYSTALMQ